MRRLIGLTAAFLIVFTSVAFASHVHTVNNWYHGLGDGTNDNSYVHPFLNQQQKIAKSSGFDLWHNYPAGEAVHDSGEDCFAVHCHVSWDTSPHAECRYYGFFVADGLNGNYHYHEGFCG